MTVAVRPAYDFAAAVKSWTYLPIDELGYWQAMVLCGWPDERIRDLIHVMATIRYDPSGWRNWRNGWREFFGLDTTHGKHVLDFGCGVGIEALQFAKAGNTASLADISGVNLLLAVAVLHAHGYSPRALGSVGGGPPWLNWPEADIDVFYASGVLHHTPQIGPILRRAVEVLRPDGEIRLLLYSDRRWTAALDGEPLPPIDMEISEHPRFAEFVQHMDPVGQYADWYTPEKLSLRLDGFARIKRWAFLGQNEEFLGAIVIPA